MGDLNVVLSAAELRYLGTLAGQAPTTISPLGGPAAGPLDPAHLAQLGLVEPGGSLAPSVAPAVKVLADARAYAGLVLQDAGTFEHVVYFDGPDRVALTSETGGFRVQDPPPSLGDLLRANLGEGILLAVELDVVFSAAEACVFLGVMDIRRRQILQALLEDREAPAVPVDPRALSAWLGHAATGSQWLAPIVRDSVGARLDPASIDAATRSLIDRQALASSGGGVTPGPAIAALADRFLLIRMLLRLRAGRVDGDGRVVTTDLRVAQSAGFQHLLWEADGAGQVHLQCVTPTGLASTIEHFLTDADALAGFAPAPVAQPVPPTPPPASPPPGPVAAPAAGAGPRFCPQCGTPTTPGARFCRSCGRQLIA